MKKSVLVLSFLVLATAYGANGQASDDDAISVTARVLAQLEVTAGNNLEFGDVARAVPKTIAPNTAAAGRFDVSGENDSEVTLDFDLPEDLVDGEFATLPVSFGVESARHHTEDNLSGGTNFDPNSQRTTNLHSNGELYVYIGGTVTPGAGQTPASYTGQITLTVAYTGI